MESVELNEEVKSVEDQEIQLVTFRLGNEEFGIDILKVREINKMMRMTLIPGTPEFMEGIINLRGHIIPVINLRKLMGMSRQDYNQETSIVVIDIPGKTYGFIVDAVREVLRIPGAVTEPPPVLSQKEKAGFVVSIAKLEDRLLFILDVEKMTAFQADLAEHTIN